MIIECGQGIGERRLSTTSLSRSRRSRPSVQQRICCCLCQRRSCTLQARAATALSDTCWAAARASGSHRPAQNSARCARAQATRLSPVVGQRRVHSTIQMVADACVARRNATSWLQARLCAMSSYLRDYAQRVRACADAVEKTLSLDVLNNFSQREYIADFQRPIGMDRD